MRVKFYTVQEVADILGIHKRTYVNYENKGVFPKAKRNPINRWRQFTKNDIQRLKEILNRAG